MNDAIPHQPIKGRGAVSAPPGRFERFAGQAVDDGWWNDPDDMPKFATRLHVDTSKSVINEIKSPDLGYMRSINPYRGCEHGCVYCYARPSHSYLGFSPGLDFEKEIFHKPDAPEILKRELSAKNYRVFPILLGSNTDCYQPVERELKVTRRIVEILAETQHPLRIITKSALVARDIDILGPMAQSGLAQVNLSITTLDPTLARAMEPRATAPYKRLKTIEALANAGIPTGLMVAPMIPGLNDMEMERIMQSAHNAGARYVGYTLIRLPYELKALFHEWLKAHYPDRMERVLSLIRETRNGKLYDADFSQRRTGEGVYADLLAQRFKQARKRYGFEKERADLRCDLFKAPRPEREQLALAF